MTEHLIYVNNWFSKYEVNRAEEIHYSIFKPVERKPVVNKSKDVAKSIFTLHIIPYDDQTDLNAMEQAVRSIEADGLVWGQAKLIPVAYGIRKLQIGCVVEDDKIDFEFLEEKIGEFEDYVQRVDLVIIQNL
ncbi:hypothetical protein I4U23_021382 [Adineta vaga]|nr:hypothetical protein I4U23_021382 [Adineta vaga]